MEKPRPEISKEMLATITAHAATVALETYKQQKEHDEKARFDRRLNNTKLLLEHYRDFSDYEDKAIYKLSEYLDEDVVDIIAIMEGRKSDEDSKIESIEKGVMRTRTIMRHVNNMLDIYKRNCDQSPNPEDRRRYRVIESLYLKKQVESVQQIAQREGIAERTVYKDVKAARKRLTALIFGIDGFQHEKPTQGQPRNKQGAKRGH